MQTGYQLENYWKLLNPGTNCLVFVLLLSKQVLMVFRNVTHFVWIGSDAWASRESVVYGREEVVEGAIAVQPLRYTDEETTFPLSRRASNLAGERFRLYSVHHMAGSVALF